MTPFLAAARSGHTQNVRALASAGADLDATCVRANKQRAVLFSAIALQVLTCVCECARCQNGMGALAMAESHPDTVEALVQLRASARGLPATVRLCTRAGTAPRHSTSLGQSHVARAPCNPRSTRQRCRQLTGSKESTCCCCDNCGGASSAEAPLPGAAKQPKRWPHVHPVLLCGHALLHTHQQAQRPLRG